MKVDEEGPTAHLDVASAHGTAHVYLSLARSPIGLVVLGHGAGGHSQSPVLHAVRDALQAASFSVALVDQAYRVAGRRMPDPAPKLDAVMLAVIADLRQRIGDVPVIVGGKSSGARVGCRVASASAAAGVVALGFPLSPPGRPASSRAHELAAGCPVFVAQGSRDAFGTPDAVREAAAGLPITVYEVSGGDHSYGARRVDGRSTSECIAAVCVAVVDWARTLISA